MPQVKSLIQNRSGVQEQKLKEVFTDYNELERDVFQHHLFQKVFCWLDKRLVMTIS